MKKIVINTCFGGFGLSEEAMHRYAELAGFKLIVDTPDHTTAYNLYYKDKVSDDNFFIEYDIARDDPFLVQVVEELGEKSNGFAADLSIVEIPDDVEWEISEYDGNEHIAEKHRRWY
jgi:hypothetical protein